MAYIIYILGVFYLVCLSAQFIKLPDQFRECALFAGSSQLFPTALDGFPTWAIWFGH